MNSWVKAGLGCGGIVALCFAGLVMLNVPLPSLSTESVSGSPPAIDTAKRPVRKPAVARPKPTSRLVWEAVGQWSGSGEQNTEKFTVTGSQWRIRWTAKDTSGFGGALFQVVVYRDQEESSAWIPINIQVRGELADEAYIQGAGTYWLQCHCVSAQWTMIAEQQKR